MNHYRFLHTYYSGRMKTIFYLILFLVALYVGIGWYKPEKITVENSKGADTAPLNQVMVSDSVFNVMIADTPEKRIKGLSGVSSLASGEGMLFVFPEPGLHGFWMKDMLFSIDILWIGADKRVVHIEEGVLPESYPSVFTPLVPASYVLEVSAGIAEEKNINIGDLVMFDIKR